MGTGLVRGGPTLEQRRILRGKRREMTCRNHILEHSWH